MNIAPYLIVHQNLHFRLYIYIQRVWNAWVLLYFPNAIGSSSQKQLHLLTVDHIYFIKRLWNTPKFYFISQMPVGQAPKLHLLHFRLYISYRDSGVPLSFTLFPNALWTIICPLSIVYFEQFYYYVISPFLSSVVEHGQFEK